MSIRDLGGSIFGTVENPENAGIAAAGERTTLSTAILQSSQVYRAGSPLITIPTPSLADTDYLPIWQEIPSALETIEPGRFAKVDPSGESANLPDHVSASEWPIKSSGNLDLENTSQYALRYEIKRRDFAQRGVNAIAGRLWQSIATGLAEAADKELLGALASESLATFSLADASAAGIQYEELAAVIGDNAIGAISTASGDLQADAGSSTGFGVPAEFTRATSQTIIGSWRHAAVAVSEKIDLLVERLGADGSLAVTVWLDLHPLIADSGKFWTASA
ncbi:hypothetical protein [Salinisphaera orenii]|uniref:hypothetical protein n=1 Tax=Salinisphaera orenii TaxID=856731 RepID=UPI0013A61EAF